MMANEKSKSAHSLDSSSFGDTDVFVNVRHICKRNVAFAKRKTRVNRVLMDISDIRDVISDARVITQCNTASMKELYHV